MPALIMLVVTSSRPGFSTKRFTMSRWSVSTTPYIVGLSTGVRAMLTLGLTFRWFFIIAARSMPVRTSPLRTKKGSVRLASAFLIAPPVPIGSFSMA
ncbi:hypothetical protein ES708_29823 [subsurface metagenome]